jgi:hypothetical protein
MKTLKKPVVFKATVLGKDLVVTVTDKTIAFRQLKSKQTLALFWYDFLVKKYYKL